VQAVAQRQVSAPVLRIAYVTVASHLLALAGTWSRMHGLLGEADCASDHITELQKIGVMHTTPADALEVLKLQMWVYSWLSFI